MHGLTRLSFRQEYLSSFRVHPVIGGIWCPFEINFQTVVGIKNCLHKKLYHLLQGQKWDGRAAAIFPLFIYYISEKDSQIPTDIVF